MAVNGIKINHLGIALEDPALFEKLWETLGLCVTSQEVVPSEKVSTRFIPIPSPTLQLELLEPTAPDSPIAKYLQNKGPGVHHISLQVENVKSVMGVLKTAGFIFVYPEPRPGAHGAFVNFIHPKSCGGILVEIAEYP